MLQVERFFRQSPMLLRQNRTLLRHGCRFWQQCRLSNEVSSFRQIRNKWNMFSLFDFVERTMFYDKLVRQCYRCWQHSLMLLRQSRTLLRHCCWCGRGLSEDDNDDDNVGSRATVTREEKRDLRLRGGSAEMRGHADMEFVWF